MPQDQLKQFRVWYESFDSDAWDKQIEQDVAAGKLDHLAEAAIANYVNPIEKSLMNIANILNYDFTSLLPRGLAIVAVRAAIRVQPIYCSWASSQSDRKSIEQSLEIARAVLQNKAQPEDALHSAEIAYKLAALAAVDFRVSKSDLAKKAACAGVVIHSAIDAVADLEADTQAVVCNVILSLQSTRRLNDSQVIQAVCSDFILLVASNNKSQQTSWTDFESPGTV